MLASNRGFTLLELMIAVAVIGLLTAIAFPSYQEQVRRGKRAEGKAALLRAAQLQERIYITGDPSVANSLATYADNTRLPTLFGLASGATVYSGENPALTTGSYTITVDALGVGGCGDYRQCFQVRATPNGSFSDHKCGQLTLSSTGVKGITGGTDTAAKCWAM